MTMPAPPSAGACGLRKTPFWRPCACQCAPPKWKPGRKPNKKSPGIARAFYLLPTRLHEALADLRTYIVQSGHGDGDQPDCNTHRLVVVQADPLQQDETDTTAAHETEQGGHTHVDIPTVDRERDHRRHDLRYHRVDHT